MIANANPQIINSKETSSKKNVLIIGAGKLGKQVANVIKQSEEANFEVVGFIDNTKNTVVDELPVIGSLEGSLKEIVKKHKVSEIVIALPYDLDDEKTAKFDGLGANVYVIPSYVNLALFRPIQKMTDLPLLRAKRPAMSRRQRILKRSFDIFVSASILLLILPVMVAIAIAIKLDSKGPVFYNANRIGENGVPFKMFKFRSMVQNAAQMQDKVNMIDEDGNTIYKTRNDPRVTRVGRIIRKTSLDELPQFINVLRGDMSLVGPRPETPKIVAAEYDDWQYRRFDVPQGITGWWQITGRSDKPCHLNTDQDIYYIENYSFKLDIQILLKTVPALLKGKGAF